MTASVLVGNWSWTLWLLIPLVLVVALITALALGELGEPTALNRREGGASRFLSRHGTTGHSNEEDS